MPYAELEHWSGMLTQTGKGSPEFHQPAVFHITFHLRMNRRWQQLHMGPSAGPGGRGLPLSYDPSLHLSKAASALLV